MIESGLFFAAGFLLAVLLAMIVAPIVWRRAVHLTRKRIENAVPLTVNELQAEKDRLRAEHAINLRKAEMALKKQREAGALQAGEIGVQAKTLADRDAELAERTSALDALTTELAELRQTADKDAADLADTRLELGTVQAALAARAAEVDSAARLRAETEAQLKKTRAELNRSIAAIAQLDAQIGEAREHADQHKQRASEAAAEAIQIADLLKGERRRAAKLERELEEMLTRQQDIEERMRRGNEQIEQLRTARVGSESEFDELERQARDAEAERDEMEHELGEMTVRVNRIAKALGGENPETVLDTLNAKLAGKDADLEAERARADQLEAQLAAVEGRAARGEAALREEIAALAAQIVHMAALLEGDASPIPDLVAGDGADEAVNGHVSLAARVRALQARADAVSAAGGRD